MWYSTAGTADGLHVRITDAFEPLAVWPVPKSRVPGTSSEHVISVPAEFTLTTGNLYIVELTVTST